MWPIAVAESQRLKGLSLSPLIASTRTTYSPVAPLSHIPWVHSPVGATPPPLVGELISASLAGGMIYGQGGMNKYQNQHTKTNDADDAAGQQEKTNQRGFHLKTGHLP